MMSLDLWFAVVAPALLAFAVAYALSRRLGFLFLALAVVLGPVGFYVAGLGLRYLQAFGSDPDESLTEGLDNLELFVVIAWGLIAWEVGLVVGAIHRLLRRRAESI